MGCDAEDHLAAPRKMFFRFASPSSSVPAMNTHFTSRRFIGVTAILVFALVAASCGGSGSTATTTTAAPTTQAPQTSTTAATTTTTEATTTTAAPATTTTTTTTTTAPTTTTVDVNTLADGSGCTPGTSDLGDGIWFGYVDSATPNAVEFDLACWFTGDAAATAAAEDGAESPPPNDYYIRNTNPQLRTITVAPNAEVSWLPSIGDPSTQTTIPYADWLVGRESRGTGFDPGVWITINNGVATFIEEQYVP
jgi:hypothetical protein